MHNTSALWKRILAEIDCQKEVKVTINGVEYGQDRIIRASVVGRLFDAPSVGGAVSRTLDLEIAPYEAPFGAIPPMSEIKLFVRLVSADGESVSEYIQKGVFYADTVKRDADTGVAEITAFDAMMKANRKLNDRACVIAYYDGFGGVRKFSCEIGDDAPTPTTPLKPGYAFVAWNPTPETVVTRDMNCAALWSRSSAVAEGDWWTLYDNWLLHIYCVGNMLNYRIMSLAPWMMSYRAQITSVTIGDSVTSIGNYAFFLCTSLTNVTIPDSVTSIGNYAFHNCTSLTSVTIPDSVTSIGNSAFGGCASLTSVTIPDSVTNIGNNAFQGCTSLTSVTIPNSVTSIGQGAFSRCTRLTSVTIPDSVTSIENSAFGDCTSLTNVTIPDSVTSIGNYAFRYCTSLTSVTISDSVTSIGNQAFQNCTSLTSVTIGDSVTNIGDYTFQGCSALTSVTIPDSVTNIGNYAFQGCARLTSVTIGDSVTSIGSAAFYGCSGLTNVTIGDSVRIIGSSAFYGCSGLTSVTIPDSVRSIGYSAFYNCGSLTDVFYGGSESQWNAILVDNNNAPLASATIHFNSSGAA